MTTETTGAAVDAALPVADTSPSPAILSPQAEVGSQATQVAADPSPVSTGLQQANPPIPDRDPSWPTVTHKLRHPLPLPGGAKLSTIAIAEPDLETLERVMDVLENLGLSSEQEVALNPRQLRPILAAFTGYDPELLKRLHFKDVMALSEAMAPLLEGLAT